MSATVETSPDARRIAAQNDVFRRNIICGTTAGEPHGRVLTTRAVADMGALFMVAATWAVATDATFTEDNDPDGDHSFGAVTVEGRKVWWKIDLYDLAYEWGSETPGDPDRTRRVLTIMFPEDY